MKGFCRRPTWRGVLIKRGAEAELRRTEFLGRPAVDKVRVPKFYRLTELDDGLRRSRIRTEARLMAEARGAGVPVPIIYDIDLAEAKIVMEYVAGPTLKEVLPPWFRRARGGARDGPRDRSIASGRDRPRGPHDVEHALARWADRDD